MTEGPEAEKALLGCLMVEAEEDARDCWDLCVSAQLKQDAFRDGFHGAVFKTVQSLRDENKNPIETLVLDRVKDEYEGAAMRLVDVTDAVDTTLFFEQFLDAVVSDWTRRRAKKLFHQTIELLDHGGDPSEHLTSLNGNIQNLLNTQVVDDVDLAETMEMVIKDMQPGGGEKYIATGIRPIDQILKRGGYGPGQLCVVAARPGNGKTALALNFVCNNMDKKMGFFSLEMGADALMERMAGIMSCVPPRWLEERIEDGLPPHAQIKAFQDALKRIVDTKNLHIDERTNLTVEQICAKARRWHRYYKIKAVVIDYLQLIKGERGMRREEQVAHISRNLKCLAKELDIPVVALCQINRESEKEDREPRMSDLRESGAIEQDADSIIFLFRKKSDEDNEKLLRWSMAKQRAGTSPWIGELTFSKPTQVICGVGDEPAPQKVEQSSLTDEPF